MQKISTAPSAPFAIWGLAERTIFCTRTPLTNLLTSPLQDGGQTQSEPSCSIYSSITFIDEYFGSREMKRLEGLGAHNCHLQGCSSAHWEIQRQHPELKILTAVCTKGDSATAAAHTLCSAVERALCSCAEAHFSLTSKRNRGRHL